MDSQCCIAFIYLFKTFTVLHGNWIIWLMESYGNLYYAGELQAKCMPMSKACLGIIAIIARQWSWLWLVQKAGRCRVAVMVLFLCSAARSRTPPLLHGLPRHELVLTVFPGGVLSSRHEAQSPHPQGPQTTKVWAFSRASILIQITFHNRPKMFAKVRSPDILFIWTCAVSLPATLVWYELVVLLICVIHLLPAARSLKYVH